LKPSQANSSARPYLEKSFTKIGLVEWLKVKALSSSPRTTKKKKKKKKSGVSVRPSQECCMEEAVEQPRNRIHSYLLHTTSCCYLKACQRSLK
jgi:uncharacterized protein YaiL (DUF2058 family)